MVKYLFPFSYVMDEDVRLLQAAMMHTDEDPTPPLSEDGVKHLMLEMYAATKEQETGKLRALADSACLPFVHLNLDKWNDDWSGRSFLCVRAFWVQDWQLRSANLAVSTCVFCARNIDKKFTLELRIASPPFLSLRWEKLNGQDKIMFSATVHLKRSSPIIFTNIMWGVFHARMLHR